MCVGGLLQTDPQERAKTTTASSGCSPRPTAPDPGAINTEPRPSWPLDPSPHDHTEPHSPTATVWKRPALTVTIVPLSFPLIFWSKFMIEMFVTRKGMVTVFPPPADERFIFGTKRSAGNSKPLVFAIRTQILAPAHLTRHTANPSRLGLRWPLHTVALPSGSLSGLTRNGAS